jgi:hypothetical protein
MSISITGLEQLYKKMGNVGATKILEPPMQRAVLRVQRTLQHYPPPPPRSTYVRTGTLGRRWLTRVKRAGNGVEGRVGTNVRYAPFVQSRVFQTGQHRRTGWTTDAESVRVNEGAIVDDFHNAVRRALAG